MEIAALLSFAILVVSWMALPASGRLEEEKAVVIRTRTVGAEA